MLTDFDSFSCRHLIFGLAFLVIYGCRGQDNLPLFEKLDPAQTSVDFTNTLKQTTDFNIINYPYFYDGGGVSIGDINNDGLPDIYLTANTQANGLYLNEGNFQFTNITELAGVEGNGDWTTGTTMADVNGDGLLDIYVCNVNYLSKNGQNQLFINNGDSTFTEQAEEYGLAFSGYSKQAAFFDMDNDGDLDMYLLNHAVHTENSFVRSTNRSKADPNSGDRLYRNDGGTFTDVTKQAGIHSSILGYGLAVTVSDVNGDNYPDIYVSNDFHENDYLYINQQDGTFEESLEESIRHTSRASMGNDIADINNDLKPDISVLDMLPADEERLKTSVSSEPYEVYSIQREFGYHPQLIRNTLQLNLGKNPAGRQIFSEIAPLAGVHATDWSWSSLLFDMNNDGSKDLFVSNGIYRRPNDKDYLSMVGGERAQRSLNEGINEKNISLADSMPHVKIPNFAFENNADLTFTDRSEEWGLATSSYSSGSAYGDLDDDGDLDLVINNVNTKATIYKNRTTEQDNSAFLIIRLQGNNSNTMGIGSKAIATVDGQKQMAELMPTRGFQSSVQPRLFLGFGNSKSIDTLKIIWPDGTQTLRTDVAPNQHLTIQQSSAEDRKKRQKNDTAVFKSIENDLSPGFTHTENGFDGFMNYPLKPYQLSSEGPGLASADVNDDGREDFYIGGARWQSGSLYIQQANGFFEKQEVTGFKEDRIFEDTEAVFFDANGDNAPDLYIVSGGNEHPVNSQNLYDRFYINDGTGQFSRVTKAFPLFGANGSIAIPLDYNGDGNLDLFVGSRSVPRNYGITPESYLFKNQGDGTFKEITDSAAPGLKRLGMISDAVSTDINGDSQPDLVVAGDWMPVTVFINKNGQLTKTEILDSGNGLWQSVHASDMDSDGDMDLLAGNMGMNTSLQASAEDPLIMYTGDFNGNGKAESVIGQTKGDEVYPIVGRDLLLQAVPYLKRKFLSYQSFAGKTLTDIFTAELLKKASKHSIEELASVYFENDGNGNFSKRYLPKKAQFAPIYAFHTKDFNADGTKDIIAGGNLFKVLPIYGGPFDASYGWFLKGQGNGSFSVLNPEQSGFYVDGEIRDILSIGTDENQRVIIGVNHKKPQFFEF